MYKEKIKDKFIYNIPPRNKVKLGDTIYFIYGNF